MSIQGENEVNNVSLLSNDGDAIATIETTDIGDKVYVATFVVPGQLFQLQIKGNNSKGNPFSRISSIGVQISDVDLKRGMHT